MKGEASEMEKTYVVIPRNCTGCRTCELACAMIKSTKEGLGRSRISIHSVGKDNYMQMTCLQCVEAACAKVCPTGALVRSKAGAIVVDEAICVGCGLCEVACPFGHIYFDESAKTPIKCDLCGGDPTCAKFCPHRALEMRK